MPRRVFTHSGRILEASRTSLAAAVVCLVLASAGLLAAPAGAHQVEKPTGNLLLDGTGAEDFIYVNDANGCTADFITAASTNPFLFLVAAVDMNTQQVGPFGSTAIAFNRVDQVFVVRSMAPMDTSGVGTGTVEICWAESAGAPCDEDNCAVPAIVDVTVLRNQQADGALDQAYDAADPVNLGTGGLYLPHRRLLDVGGPMPLRLSLYYDSKLFSDQLVGMPGFNWLSNFDWLLLPAGNNRLVMTPRGRLIRFEKGFFESTWTLRPRQQIPFQLYEVNGDFVFVDPRDQRIYTFNATGQLVKIEDGRGNTHTITHDFADRVQTASDGLGRQLTFTYGVGLATASDGTRTVTLGYTGNDVTSITDAAGNPTNYTYVATSLLESETRPEGNSPYTQTWDGKDRVQTQTDAFGNTGTFSYDDALGERSYQNPLSQTETHAYGDRYRLESYTDPLGATATVTADSVGRRAVLTDREGGVTTWDYKPENGKLTQVQHADGTVTNYSYTSRLLHGLPFEDLTSVQRPDGSSESFAYDSTGNLTSWMDGASNTWTYTYNANGQVLTVTNPATGTAVNTWNPDGTLDTATDPASNTTSFEYDALRRPNKVTRPGGAFRMLAYDDRDLLTSLTNEENETTAYGYDMNGNLTSVTSPLGLTTTFGYDLMDRPVSVTNHLGHAYIVSYDAAGRLSQTTDANGITNMIGRDSRGYPTSITDGEGKVWLRSVDHEGIPTGFETPLSRTVTYSSDAMGRITQMLSPMGHTVGVTYDGMGAIDQLTDPLGRITDVTRDGRGFISQVARGSISTSYARNVFGQITDLTDPRGKFWQRAYDTSARLTSRTDPLGQATTFTYDSRNRPATTTFPGGMESVTHAYDNVNRLTGLSYTDSTTLGFTYDDDGRLTAATGISLGYDDADRLTSCNGLTMAYDPGGRLTSVTLAPGKIVTYGYDSRNLVTSITDWVGGVTTIAYDDDARLQSISRPNGIVSTYVHDDDGCLTSIQHGGLGNVVLERDEAGQIATSSRDWPTVAAPTATLQTLTYDDANQVIGYTHDPMGRVQIDGARAVDWDLASRATSIDHGGGPVGFTYDAADRLLTRSESGTTREFVWNYATAIPTVTVERETGSGDLRYYVHTPGGVLLHSVSAADDTRRFHYEDEMGNTVFLTNDAGTVTDSYAYDPWGVLLAQSGGTENHFLWGGSYGAMREGDLYRIGVRLYNPQEARWLSRDPLGGFQPRNVNPYQALYGNPAMYVDPFGTEPLIVLAMIRDAFRRCRNSMREWWWEGAHRYEFHLMEDKRNQRQIKELKALEAAQVDIDREEREEAHRLEEKERRRDQRFEDELRKIRGWDREFPSGERSELGKAGEVLFDKTDCDGVRPDGYAEEAPSGNVDPNVPPRPSGIGPARLETPLQVSPQTQLELWMDEFMQNLVPAPPPQPDGRGSSDTFERPPSSFSPSSMLLNAYWEPGNLRRLPIKMRRDIEGPLLPAGRSAEIK